MEWSLRLNQKKVMTPWSQEQLKSKFRLKRAYFFGIGSSLKASIASDPLVASLQTNSQYKAERKEASKK